MRAALWGRPSGVAAWGSGALACVLLLVVLAPSASARSVRDPDIGWPTALRRELHLPQVSSRPCTARATRSMVRLQDRIAARDPRDALYTIFHDRPHTNIWGTLWYTNCFGGRLQVGVASGGTAARTRHTVAKARATLKRMGVARDVRLVAVRSTYRQLSEESDAFGERFDALFQADVVSSGIDPSRNALVIDVAGEATAGDRSALRAFAAASPVNVLLEIEPPPDPNAPVATYDAIFRLDRAAVRRDARAVTVTIDDPSCAADETFDTARRLAGVRVRRVGHAFVLRARLRVNPDWPRASTCEGSDDPRLSVTKTVALPSRLGTRGIVDGAEGPGGFRIVALPPVGARAIRSLVPKFIYSGEDCERGPVRRAFRGRPKSDWCFF